MKKTLTSKFIEGVKCPEGRMDIFDALTTGLNLRVTADKKAWSFVFTPPGTTVRARLALGTFPATGLDDARERAVKARGLVEAGTDPRDVIPVEAPKTMAELIQERLELEVRGKLRTAAAIEKRYAKYITPLVGDVHVTAFRIDPHYNKCVDPLKKRNKLRMAGIIHTDLVCLMEFAKRRGVILYSTLDAAQTADPKNVRKRNLSPVEIPLFWHALAKVLRWSKTVQRILKLCLVTGQRVGEVCGAMKSEFNWLERIWTIPASRVKNGDTYGDHIVPLSDLAIELFREAMAVNSNLTEWVFPNDAQDGPLNAEVVASTLKRAFDRGDFTIPAITPHDLRRTVGTQMLNRKNGLKISKHEKYLVLNHQSALKDNVSDEVYDQNEYTDEKREALEKWGAFLSQLVAPVAMQVAA